MTHAIRLFGTYIAIAVLSALLFGALCMIPFSHTIDIGGYDSAYTQGFFDQEPIPAMFQTDGMARWSGIDAALIVPQYATPMQLTIRASAPVSKTLALIANGTTTVWQRPITPQWQDITVMLAGGTTKPFTVYLALRSDVATWQSGDLRRVGVLVDRVTISTPAGALPYPWPCIWVMLSSVLCALVITPWVRTTWPKIIISSLVPVALALMTWRWQMWYPIPSSLAWVCGILTITLILRHRAYITQHMPWWGDALSLSVITIWTMMLAVAQRSHVTLAVPGVEKDFRVFATRSESYASVFSADAFYNLGYPLILRLVTHISGLSPFDAAKWWAVIIACLALLATWWLARFVLGARWAVLMTITVACSTVFTQYALSLGSDMTFTALCTFSIAVLLRARARPHWHIWAGMVAGGAFLVRHTGVILIIVICLWRLTTPDTRRSTRIAISYLCAGWLLVAMCQLAVNFYDTGELFYSHQAKNSWLAVYGNVDWGRWGDVPDTISLRDVIFNDPARFMASWWHNVTAVWGSSTGEYERAMFIRLLSIPMNWLSIAGILFAIRVGWRTLLPPTVQFAGLWLAGFVGISAVAFLLPRFLLPLVWVAAYMAVWLIAQHAHYWQRTTLLWGISGLILLQSGGVFAGHAAVIALQPPDERAVISYVQDTYPDTRIAFVVGPESPLGKYSALAEARVFRTIRPPVDVHALCAQHPDVIIWSHELSALPASFLPHWQYERYAVVSGDACQQIP